MEITCDVVMDLVDVYTSGIAGEYTMRAVGDHLKTCGECRKYYAEYKKTLEKEKKNNICVIEKLPDSTDDVILESLNKLSKRLRTRRTIRNITSVFAVTVSLVVLLKNLFGDERK